MLSQERISEWSRQKRTWSDWTLSFLAVDKDGDARCFSRSRIQGQFTVDCWAEAILPCGVICCFSHRAHSYHVSSQKMNCLY